MDTQQDSVENQQFWKLIDDARRQAPDPTDGYAVAARATALLSARPGEEIVAAGQVLRKLMADSYRSPLWAAAYLINGRCSDDGFEYFRGWLIVQGREVFERIVTDPDALAELPLIRAQMPGEADAECEGTLYIAWKVNALRNWRVACVSVLSRRFCSRAVPRTCSAGAAVNRRGSRQPCADNAHYVK